MFKYYLKSAFSSLLSNRKVTIINIAGFSFAVSVCLALGLYLAKQYSFDRYNINSDRIVRLIDTEDNSSHIDYRVKDILVRNFPEIENGCLVLRSGRPIEVRCHDKGFYLDDIMSVDNSFFEIFTVKMIYGPGIHPFKDINSAVITQSTSRKLFGEENPMGQELLVWGSIPVEVTGVIEDFPGNSSITAGILVNAEKDEFKLYQSIGNSDDLSTYRWLFQIYLKISENCDRHLLLRHINENISLLQPYTEKAGFLELRDIYLHDTTTGSETRQGNPGLLNLLTAIALIIMLLAIINYVNLTVAQQHKRNKDTGIRKTFGSTRSGIFLYYLSESLLVVTVSFILGIYLLSVMIPFYNTVFDTSIDLSDFMNIPSLFILACSIIIIGIISGSYPAVVLSGITPVKVLSGVTVKSGRKHHFRNVLTIFQFTISIVLIFCVIIVMRQIRFVKHKDPGFTEELLVRIDIPNIQENDQVKALAFVAECRNSPFIRRASLSSGIPGNIPLSMGSNMENTTKNMSVPCLIVDTSFLETFGMKVIRGRKPEPGDYGRICLINEAAWRHFEFDDLENKRFNNYGGFDIIGVVNDFQFTSLHKTIGPACLMITPAFRPTTLSVRFNSNSAGQGIEYIKRLWEERLPVYPFKYQFYDEWFDSLYQSEEKFARTISLFAILAIIISCIGIIGLAIFSMESRTKETGIRKVNGAGIPEVILALNKSFMIQVLIAFIIGLPVMYFSMDKWLNNFAYRTTLDWWIFVLSGLIAFFMALTAVSWQSWQAAARNPVESLRYE